MDILGIGPLELIFVLIIALIVLGPKDMVKAGKTIGKFLRQIVTSPTWHAVTKTSSELRNLPTKLIRDAGLEDDIKQIQDVAKNAVPSSLNQDLSKWQDDINSWTTPAADDKLAEEANQNEDDSTSLVGSEQDLQPDESSQTIAPPDISQSEEKLSPDTTSQTNQEQAD
jgi:Sec-independent protein translocase protein TatA